MRNQPTFWLVKPREEEKKKKKTEDKTELAINITG